jgi:hypothetical protein
LRFVKTRFHLNEITHALGHFAFRHDVSRVTFHFIKSSLGERAEKFAGAVKFGSFTGGFSRI